MSVASFSDYTVILSITYSFRPCISAASHCFDLIRYQLYPSLNRQHLRQWAHCALSVTILLEEVQAVRPAPHRGATTAVGDDHSWVKMQQAKQAALRLIHHHHQWFNLEDTLWWAAAYRVESLLTGKLLLDDLLLASFAGWKEPRGKQQRKMATAESAAVTGRLVKQCSQLFPAAISIPKLIWHTQTRL